MFLKLLLVTGLIATVIYMMIVATDTDRYIRVKSDNINAMAQRYGTKRNLSPRRVVLILECDNGLCVDTLKSLLDQSLRVDDIAVETNRPERISDDMKRVVSVHKPGTAPIRETECDTIVFYLKNGKFYDYDYLENEVNKLIQ